MLAKTAPGLLGPNEAAPDRTCIFGKAAWASARMFYANRDADKLEVNDPAILLKPRKEAKAEVALCLYDGGRLRVSAFAPASFWS
jgi:hypothetical protein